MKNKNKLYFLLIILSLLIVFFSVFKIINSDTFIYPGKNSEYKFTKEKVADIRFYRPHIIFSGKEYIYAFRNKPQDLETLPMNGDFESILKRPQIERVFITRDLNLSALTNEDVSIAIAPLDDILNTKKPTSIYNLQFDREFTEFGEENTKNRIIDCDTANHNIKKHLYLVIYMKLGDSDKVYNNGDCIIIQGKDSKGLIKSSEKLAYYLLGIF